MIITSIGIDLWLPDLPPLVFEAVPPLAVNHPDAVQGPYDEQGPCDANAHRGQHARHITCLKRVNIQMKITGQRHLIDTNYRNKPLCKQL